MNLERAALNIKNNYGIIREETLACRAPSIARGSRQRWDDEVHGNCVPRRGVRRARAHRSLGQAENLGRFDFWEHQFLVWTNIKRDGVVIDVWWIDHAGGGGV